MSLKFKHHILFVDDEESILKTLRRVFKNEGYEIHTASSPQQGLTLIEEAEKPFSLIISDQKMPGMSGVEFLKASRNKIPHAMKILLTGYSDIDAIASAVNEGGIHRYITKPWDDEDIKLQVHQILEQYELRIENNKLTRLIKRQNQELKEINKNLEEKIQEKVKETLRKNKELERLNHDLETNLFNTVKSFGSLVERHNPLLNGHGRRVAELSKKIAMAFGLSSEEINQIEIAAVLHDIGKLGFSERLFNYEENKWTVEEKLKYRRHPQYGQETVHFINRLDYVGMIIRSHHEQYDGNGYPDNLAEEEIPFGARIISVVDAYDKIVNLRIDVENAIKNTRNANKFMQNKDLVQKAAVAHLKKYSFINYDPDVVKILLNIIKNGDATHRKERIVVIKDLVEGDTLSRPLYSSGGRFLLPENTVMTKNFIRKLRLLQETDSVTDDVYVLRS